MMQGAGGIYASSAGLWFKYGILHMVSTMKQRYSPYSQKALDPQVDMPQDLLGRVKLG